MAKMKHRRMPDNLQRATLLHFPYSPPAGMSTTSEILWLPFTSPVSQSLRAMDIPLLFVWNIWGVLVIRLRNERGLLVACVQTPLFAAALARSGQRGAREGPSSPQADGAADGKIEEIMSRYSQ
jgi:hypothetical protein